eukprot:5308842-Amphidinium_carterae.1
MSKQSCDRKMSLTLPDTKLALGLTTTCSARWLETSTRRAVMGNSKTLDHPDRPAKREGNKL